MTREQKVILHRFINQRYALDRFEDAALESLLRFYRRARKQTQRDIAKAIKGSINYPAQRRLELLYNEIDVIINVLTEKLNKPVIEAVVEAGKYSYESTNAILSWDNQVKEFDNVALSANQIAALITIEEIGDKTLNGWLWDALNENNGALKEEIAAARVRGAGYKKILSELGDRYDDLFSGSQIKNNLETVVKSYIQAINAKAHKDLYEANKNVIKEVEWSAILENGNTETGKGTCPRCMALDGQKWPSVSKAPNCPLHPRCRCMLMPVTKSWKDLGLDVEKQNTKYRKWYERSPSRKRLAYGLTDKDFKGFWKTKPVEWQNNAVGPVRAKLIRKGVVDFKDIVNKKGDLIPLKKLADEEALKDARKHRR